MKAIKKIHSLFYKEDYLSPSVFIMRLIRQNSKMEHAILRYICGMEVCMTIFGLLNFNLSNPRAQMHLVLYITLALVAFLSDRAFSIGEKRNTVRRNRLILAAGYFFYAFIHIWAVLVTTMEVLRGGTYWVAATASIATAVFVVLRPAFCLGVSLLTGFSLGALYVYTEGWSAGLLNIILFAMVLCIINIRMYIGAYNTMYVEDQLRELSFRDGLTAVRNRRSLDDRISGNGTPVKGAVAIMDIDNFKTINDTEGHQSGDEALLLVTSCLRDLFKDEEIYRYGGDEFVILSEKNAEETARKLRRVNERLAAAEREFDIRVSCGVAELESDKTLEEIIGLADQSLYKIKESGKGQVGVFSNGTERIHF